MNAMLKSDLIRQTESGDWSDDMAEDSLGELRSDVRHIQSDVTEIKAEVRANNVRLDTLRDKFDASNEESMKRFEAAGVRQDNERKELGQKIDGTRDKIEGSVNSVRDRIEGSVNDVRDKVDELGKDTFAELTGLNAKLGAKVDELRKDSFAEFASLNAKFGAKVDELRKDTFTEFANVRAEFKELSGRIDGVKDSLASAKIWALRLYFGLYIGLAGGLLYAMARGFKWI